MKNKVVSNTLKQTAKTPHPAGTPLKEGELGRIKKMENQMQHIKQ